MKFIISTNKNTLELINKRINDKMFADIPNYKAKQWGKIRENKLGNNYILEIGEDLRNPLDILKANEIAQLKNKRPKEFKREIEK